MQKQCFWIYVDPEVRYILIYLHQAEAHTGNIIRFGMYMYNRIYNWFAYHWRIKYQSSDRIYNRFVLQVSDCNSILQRPLPIYFESPTCMKFCYRLYESEHHIFPIRPSLNYKITTYTQYQTFFFSTEYIFSILFLE